MVVVKGGGAGGVKISCHGTEIKCSFHNSREIKSAFLEEKMSFFDTNLRVTHDI